MKDNMELIRKAKCVKSIQELKALADAENYFMTDEQAENMFSALHTNRELSDDELVQVSGGTEKPSDAELAEIHKRSLVAPLDTCHLTPSGFEAASETQYEICRNCKWMQESVGEAVCAQLMIKICEEHNAK